MSWPVAGRPIPNRSRFNAFLSTAPPLVQDIRNHKLPGIVQGSHYHVPPVTLVSQFFQAVVFLSPAPWARFLLLLSLHADWLARGSYQHYSPSSCTELNNGYCHEENVLSGYALCILRLPLVAAKNRGFTSLSTAGLTLNIHNILSKEYTFHIGSFLTL